MKTVINNRTTANNIIWQEWVTYAAKKFMIYKLCINCLIPLASIHTYSLIYKSLVAVSLSG